jgi:hypothetical protein
MDNILTSQQLASTDHQTGRADGRASRLRFFSEVLAFSQQIRGASDDGQFLHEVGQAICELFECEA